MFDFVDELAALSLGVSLASLLFPPPHLFSLQEREIAVGEERLRYLSLLSASFIHFMFD